MDCYIWICCDDADNILSVNKIYLGTENTGGKVTWHNNNTTSGTWWCCTGEAGGPTYVFVEFAAGKGKYKRHVLQEVDHNLFKLLPVGHQLYTRERWSQETDLHGNGGSRVYLQRFQAPATTAAEAAEATEQPNYRDRDQPREEEPWIRVDAAVPPPEEAEHDATLPPPEEAENDAEPQLPEKAEHDAEPTPPCWARKGAAAPESSTT